MSYDAPRDCSSVCVFVVKACWGRYHLGGFYSCRRWCAQAQVLGMLWLFQFVRLRLVVLRFGAAAHDRFSGLVYRFKTTDFGA